MIQLLLIIISIIYGFLYSLLTTKLKLNKINYIILTIIMTLIYVLIIYKLYNGNLSFVLKLSLITGYILCKVLKNKCKASKKNKDYINNNDII